MAHPLAPTPEQESLRALRSLVIDLYERGDPETARRLPVIAYRIANSASDRQSERLLQNALDIWLMELALLPRARADSIQGAVTELVAEMAYYVIVRFAGQMENDYAPLDERLGALPFLARLATFEAEGLKLHIDHRDRQSFDDAHRRWSDAWFRHWTPEREVEEIEYLDETGDREIARRLETARRLADGKAEALRAHSRAYLELGAWVAYERRHDRMDEDDFSFFSRFLVGAVQSSRSLVDELADLASDGWDAALLERWDLPIADPSRSRRVMTGWVAGRDILRFWLTLLLARFMTGSTEVLHRPEGLPDWVVEEMRSHLDAVNEQWDKWREVVGDRGNIGHAREWLDEEARRGQEAGRIRITDAPLDLDRVAEFVRSQQNSFAREAVVREQIILVGASRVERETHPARGLRRFPLRRDLFVEGGPLMVGVGELGAELGHEVDRAIYTALSEVASPGPGADEPVEGIIAIASEMAAAGWSPHAVLAPATVWIRPPLGQHPRFRWRPRQLVDDRGALGHIDELPVYDVGPAEADQLLVVNFAGALTLVERRPASAERPVQVTVSDYSPERAAELVGEGFRFSDQPGWSSERVAEFLVRRFVEVSVHLDYEVELQDDAAEAARRIRVAVERSGDG